MAIVVRRVEFKGVVRCTSPQNNDDGNCEEVVNLRLDSGAWRLVGEKKSVVEDVDYQQVYVHKYGTFENFIGLKSGMVVWFALLEDGSVVEKHQEVCDISGEVRFNQLNNILLVCDKEKIVKIVFDGEKYGTTTETLLDVPLLEINQKYLTSDGGVPIENDYTTFSVHFNKIDEINAAKEMIRGMLNKEKERYPGYVEGYTFLCTTYQLFDGSETKPTPPKLVEIGKYVDCLLRVENKQYDNSDNHHTANLWVKDMNLRTLRLKVSAEVPEEFREVVTRVNVYVSPVRSFYDTGNIRPDYVISELESYQKKAIPLKELTREEVEKLLFYRVMSVDVMDQSNVYTEIKFDNTLTANPTLPIDTSGWLDRSGEMFVYNNRLHLYNVRQRFVDSRKIGACWYPYEDPQFSNLWDIRDMAVFVSLKVAQKDVVVRYDCRLACPDLDNLHVRFPKVISFPDSRAYQIAFYDRNVKSTPFVVKLRPSASYNFAFGILDQTNVAIPATGGDVEFPKEDNYMEDNMTLLVSEAMNPYYFPPSHSYLMPGEIVNLAVNTEQISASQVGQYPLYVFTTEGIYALQVGDGKVLYSNVVPVSAEVAVPGGAVLQTKYGVVFVTAKGLKVISGTQVADFSKPLDGGLDLALRKSRHYPQVMRNARMGADFGAMASVVPFREYSRGAVMGYDISEDEVIVSNPAYGYSYVFGLETKAWHKITDVFVGISRHLGLQEYLAAPKGARARVDIVSTIHDGFVQQYDWSVEIPHMELYAGSVLILVGSQILVSFTTAQPLTLEQALGRMKAPRNVAYYDSGTKTLYLSTKSDRMNLRASGIPPRTFLFSKNSAEIPVPPKGHGQNIGLMLAGREFSYTTKPTDTAASIAKEMAALAKGIGFGVETDEGGLFVEALPGAAGNDIPPILCKSSPNVSLKATPFSGGEDACWKKRVCDLREEEEGIRPVYLQTRPMHLGSEGYKKIRHLAMEGEFKPDPSKYYGIFVYASDNLSDWTLVGEGAFNRNGSRLTLPMVDKSYRYFTVAIGGVVCSGHVLSFLDLACEAKLNNRLR